MDADEDEYGFGAAESEGGTLTAEFVRSLVDTVYYEEDAEFPFSFSSDTGEGGDADLKFMIEKDILDKSFGNCASLYIALPDAEEPLFYADVMNEEEFISENILLETEYKVYLIYEIEGIAIAYNGALSVCKSEQSLSCECRLQKDR